MRADGLVSTRARRARTRGARHRWTGELTSLEPRQLLSMAEFGMVVPSLVGPLPEGVVGRASAAQGAGVTFVPGNPFNPRLPRPVVGLQGTPEVPETSPSPRPLTELTEPYRGVEPGLYGGGRNTPPPELEALASGAAGQIQPLDRRGVPSPNGTIGLVLIGPSTTMMQGQIFRLVAHRAAEVSPRVRVINGGQNAMVAQSWASINRPWAVLDRALMFNGMTRHQVQVVWIKAAHLYPQRQGEFPAHAERYADLVTTIVQRAKAFFPNLRVAYLSSEINFSFARSPTHPEPCSFEEAFGVRSAIRRQLDGDPGLNADPTRGPVVAPVLLWGPYLWAPTDVPRADGLMWTRSDFLPDGVHPSPFGRVKVAGQLHRFFLNDPHARSWYQRA